MVLQIRVKAAQAVHDWFKHGPAQRSGDTYFNVAAVVAKRIAEIILLRVKQFDQID
ncbi:hypothetical protein D3C75_1085090 [compost metagenome]